MGKEVLRHDEIQGDILHEYDGIEEADNHLPNWWLFIFYGSIVFAVFYWFYYHEYEVGLLPMAAYTKALEEQAGDGADVSEEALLALVNDQGAVAEGQTAFNTNCAACHEANAGGKIGPNLTDPYWIHGGGAQEIYGTIYEGVLEKGMPAWGQPLGAPTVQKVTAYVLSLRNTEVAGGKEAEGELYDPEGHLGDPTEPSDLPAAEVSAAAAAAEAVGASEDADPVAETAETSGAEPAPRNDEDDSTVAASTPVE